MKHVPALIVLAALGAPLAAADQAPFTVEESGEGFYRLDDAVAAVGDGEATIAIAPGTYRECAVQKAGLITFKAITPGSVIFDGKTCDGKAALVLSGRGARVEGIIFQNMRVPDGNGAGIRLESANLEVANSIFRNSEEGILTGPDPEGQILIEYSTFSGLGRCDRDLDCAHSVYIGNYGSVTIRNVRFERGRGGHYLKSNAARVDVRGSSFDDTEGSTTNYMIDLPSGATGIITGNTFVQGAGKENYTKLIAIAAEGRKHRSAGLVIQGNTARLGRGAKNTTFVADWSHEPLKIGQNTLGAGIAPFAEQ